MKRLIETIGGGVWRCVRPKRIENLVAVQGMTWYERKQCYQVFRSASTPVGVGYGMFLCSDLELAEQVYL